MTPSRRTLPAAGAPCSPASVALTTLGGRTPLETALLDGYRAVHPLLDGFDAERPWFVRLRRLTVLLARLWAFGPVPTDDQRALLATLRARVHRP